MLNVVITMAGRGSRFRAAGYERPKYEIEAHGRSLFDWSMLSLRNFLQPGARVIYVCLRENDSAPYVRARSRALGLHDVHVVELDALSDGQATSACAARGLWRAPQPLLVYNIDTYVHPRSLHPGLVRPGSDGWIPCFQAAGSHWSFVRVGADGWAEEVKEKARISPHASIGLYWFRSAADYAAAYDDFFARPDSLVAGERYVAPLYTALLRRGRRVSTCDLPAHDVHVLGTPGELDAFLATDPASLA